MDELLTVAEIADRLKVNRQTVRNWIDRGELGDVRRGSRRVRVPASELDRFIAESSSVGIPDEQAARTEYIAAPAAVDGATTDVDLATALKGLARAATELKVQFAWRAQLARLHAERAGRRPDSELDPDSQSPGGTENAGDDASLP